MPDVVGGMVAFADSATGEIRQQNLCYCLRSESLVDVCPQSADVAVRVEVEFAGAREPFAMQTPQRRTGGSHDSCHLIPSDLDEHAARSEREEH